MRRYYWGRSNSYRASVQKLSFFRKSASLFAIIRSYSLRTDTQRLPTTTTGKERYTGGSRMGPIRVWVQLRCERPSSFVDAAMLLLAVVNVATVAAADVALCKLYIGCCCCLSLPPSLSSLSPLSLSRCTVAAHRSVFQSEDPLGRIWKRIKIVYYIAESTEVQGSMIIGKYIQKGNWNRTDLREDSRLPRKAHKQFELAPFLGERPYFPPPVLASFRAPFFGSPPPLFLFTATPPPRSCPCKKGRSIRVCVVCIVREANGII